MADSIYPVFNVPQPTTDAAQADKYSPAPMFDFEKGDFVRDGMNRIVTCDGREAYRQWCKKVLRTQKGRCLAYIGIGIEEDKALAQPNRLAVQSAYERTITEALLQHPCTQRVKDFVFSWEADTLKIHFTIKAKDIAAFDIELDVVTG